MAHYTIKDLEKLSGIKAHTIRIWEKRYSLIEPGRTDTNIRTYCDQDLKRLLNVSMLNRNGYRISKIAELSNEELSDKIAQLAQDVNDTNTQIENLTIAMLELDEGRFEKTLSRTIIHLGFEETMSRVVYPFFVKTGLMWQTGTIVPAQEHFVTNIIRQKLIVAIDSQIVPRTSETKNFLFFLPEGELHEIGLLFYSYLTRKRGQRSLYIGQWVPYKDLKEVATIQSVEYIVTSFYSMTEMDARKFVNKLSLDFPNQQIIIIGGMCKEVMRYSWSNVNFCVTPDSYTQLLDQLNKH